MADMVDEGIVVSHFYSDDGEKEAVVKRDGYGVYFIEYMLGGVVVEVVSCPKYTLNTVEDIAEDYVMKGKENDSGSLSNNEK